MTAGISEPFMTPRVRLNMSEPHDAGEACVPYEFAQTQAYFSPKVCVHVVRVILICFLLCYVTHNLHV
jgi:hypothetical protein